MTSLAENVLKGDTRALARTMRLVDDRASGYVDLLKALYPHTGRAWIVGITGNPGAGKSTLCDRLIETFRKSDKRIGVIAVDPTSPFSGGAILGDRIRMQRHALDPGVFIRSVATRGHLGGLSRSARDMVRVLDAAGCDIVLVETVGVGQDELEIAQTAHTTLVVTAPGMGDEVQAIKAGIMECADAFAVNKADRDGADAAVRDLELMIALGKDTLIAATSKIRGHVIHGGSADAEAAAHGVSGEGHEGREGQPGREGSPAAERWTPPIVRCVSPRNEGIADLAVALERHRVWVSSTAAGQARRAARVAQELREGLRQALIDSALAALGPTLEAAALRVQRREIDPYSLTEELVREFRYAAGRP